MNPQNRTTPLALDKVRIDDAFWSAFMERVRKNVIPYQWEALNDRVPGAAPSYCMRNFRIAAGMEEGDFGGFVFQDSDFAKWIEAVGYSLIRHPDPELEKTADEAIDIVVAAQQPDGYMDTYYIIKGLDKRFTNLRDNHELYVAGHMIEGAIAYWQATGKRKLLDAVIRLADLIDDTFGPEPPKMPGYPGHEIIEMALVRLYYATNEPRYLSLAKYFVDQRGQSPNYFAVETERNGGRYHWEDSYFKLQYYQAGKPVREQKEAEGHSVRATYLYSGMADVARETDDRELYEACRNLWDNMVSKRMYITGGIGSSRYGEAFTFDYDLPNDTVYAETCASIGLVFFARRMLEIEPDAEYADVMERALYNGIISGMSLAGTEFFYVNPLEVLPEGSQKDQLRKHVLPERPAWFGCACCPPNLARLLSSLGAYAYTVKKDALYVHLYMGGSLTANLSGTEVSVDVESDYPWNGKIAFTVKPEKDARFTLALRKPGWCREYALSVNGEKMNAAQKAGYLLIGRVWSPGDRVELILDMPVQLIHANPAVRADIGKVAVQRGPVVFCLEEADNGKGLQRVYIDKSQKLVSEYRNDLLGGIQVITAKGKRLTDAGWEKGSLYRAEAEPAYEDIRLSFIPYYAWANRRAGEMTVWVRILSR